MGEGALQVLLPVLFYFDPAVGLEVLAGPVFHRLGAPAFSPIV
jgi:hypothetical protein